MRDWEQQFFISKDNTSGIAGLLLQQLQHEAAYIHLMR